MYVSQSQLMNLTFSQSHTPNVPIHPRLWIT